MTAYSSTIINYKSQKILLNNIVEHDALSIFSKLIRVGSPQYQAFKKDSIIFLLKKIYGGGLWKERFQIDKEPLYDISKVKAILGIP